MRYYHDHELAYQNLLRRGDDGLPGREFALRDFLEHFVAAHYLDPRQSRSLELGCGAGPAAVFCAELGFQSFGIDISPTAIALARKRARELNLPVHYEIADVLRLPDELGRFDLVVDGSCLHCLVFDDDRSQALRSIHSHLGRGGYFLIQSMVTHPLISFAKNWTLDASGILWFRSSRSCLAESRLVAGESWVPQRRLRTPEGLEVELRESGFKIIDSVLLTQPQESRQRPNYIRLVCQLA